MGKIVKNMSKSLVGFLRVALSVCLMLGLLFGSYTYLNRVFRNKDFDAYGKAFHNMPADSLDVVTMGSSHAEYSFSPAFFYEETGLYAYTFGSACQPYEVTYEMLEEVYKTQNPKLLIFEVFTAMPLREGCDGDSCYVFAQYRVTGKERYDILDYLPEEKSKEYYNEFLNFHNDWKTMEDPKELLPENALNDYTDIDNDFGYLYTDGYEWYPANWWHANHVNETVEVQLDNIDLEMLEKIYQLTQEHGTQILMYKTPIDGIEIVNQSYLNKVWEWADAHDVPYIDFIQKSRELGYYMYIHSDSYHANVTGAGIVTDYLAQYVNGMDIDFDHKDSDFLTPIYDHRAQELATYYTKFEHHAVKYTKFLSHDFDGYFFLRYYPLGGFNSELLENLKAIGFTDFDPNYSYYGVVKDGELVASSTEYVSYFIDEREFYIDKNAINDWWDPISDPESFLTLAYYTNDLSDRVVKEIEYRWGGYDRGYGEYDWDR